MCIVNEFRFGFGNLVLFVCVMVSDEISLSKQLQ